MTLESQIAKLTNETTELLNTVNSQLSDALVELNILRKMVGYDFLVSKDLNSNMNSSHSVEDIQNKIVAFRGKAKNRDKHVVVFITSFTDLGAIQISVPNTSFYIKDGTEFEVSTGESAILIDAENVSIRGGIYKYQQYNRNNIPFMVKSGSCKVLDISTINANTDPKAGKLDYIGSVDNKET